MTDPPPGPTARAATPPPPPGDHDLTPRGGEPVHVAVDTNTILDGYYREPLRASAVAGDLVVSWSPSIVRELVKVVYREGTMSALAGGAPSSAALRLLFNRIAFELEDQLFELEHSFRFAVGEATVEPTLLDAVTDPDDRPILRAALAAGVSYPLSLDRRHLPHGTVFHGVRCWHPDTFLTLFYEQNPDAYDRAIDLVRETPASVRRRLLPGTGRRRDG